MTNSGALSRVNAGTGYAIATSQAAACVIALNELQRIDGGARLVKKLSLTEQLVSVPSGYGNFVDSLRAGKALVIFVRHIFPVTFADWEPEDRDSIASALDPALPFAIQARGGGRLSDITVPLEETLIERGFTHDHKSPAQVVSVYGSEGTFYAGVSAARDNISIYNGGMHRFKRDDGLISRAEFKLLEAAADFGVVLPVGGRALDLGAAPGGFSRGLLEKGLEVTAVDPAEMDVRLRAYGGRFIHCKCTAENFAGEEGTFDVLTNDIKADIPDSVKIMKGAAKFLKPGGQALMTLKLSGGSWLKQTNAALRSLEGPYTVLAARQLFNNRSEVTVLLRKNG